MWFIPYCILTICYWITRNALASRTARNSPQEFDVVHLVVALHRIAKSTDFQQLRHSAPLREQLAQLAKSAAQAVGMPGDPRESTILKGKTMGKPGENGALPSGKQPHRYGKSPSFM